MARLYTLGRFELRASDGPIGSLISAQPKRLALLTYLAADNPRKAHRRDALMSLFWPDAGQDEARNALRQALHHLRQIVGDDAIVTRSDDQVELTEDGLWCDASQLERAISAGDDASALTLYQGSFLDAVFVRGVAPELEEWFDRTRSRVRSAAAGAARRLAEHEANAGRIDSAIAAARRHCEIDPNDEAALRSLMSLLVANGARADAIQEFERQTAALRERLGVEPSRETMLLADDIRTGALRRAEKVVVSPAPSTPTHATLPIKEAPAPSPRRWWPIAAGVVALVGVASLVFATRRSASGERLTPVASTTQDRVFVVDFVDRNPQTRLGVVVAEAMRIDLAQSSALRVLTPAQVRAAVRLLDRPVEVTIDDSLARAIAVREGVKGFVTGDVNVVGSTIVLSARLVSAVGGDELAAAREVARDSADLIPAIDRLSRSLRHRVGENLTQVSNAMPLSRVTTPSLAALEKYTQGLRQIDAGARAEGVVLLQQAVAIDSGFATAWRMLGSTYGVLGEPSRASEALHRAFEHRSRLTYKERYLVMGSYYRNATQEYEKAVAAYRSLLELYPNDIAALNNLGLTYISLGKPAQAETLMAKVVAADSSQVNARLVLAELMATQGRFSPARAVLDETSRRFPANPTVGLTRIYVATAEQDWPEAQQHAERRLAAVTANVQRIDALQTLGQIELVRGQLARARTHLEESLALAKTERSPRKYLWSSVVLGWLDLRYRNDPAGATRRVQEALRVYPLQRLSADDIPAPQLTELLVALGMPEEARRLAARAADSISSSSSVAERQHLAGIVAGANGQWREAASALQLATSDAQDCPICTLPALAVALERSGDAEGAIAVADRYVRTPFIQRFEPDASNLAATLELLGTLYERQGQPLKAAASYRKLLELWRDADAEMAPRVAAITDRLAKAEGR